MGSGVLGTAVSGLLVAQRSLEVTANNISNVNTEGYNRQSVEQSAQGSQLTGGGFVGRGVQITNITRSYDQFLTGQLRTSNSAFGDVNQYKQLAGQVDSALADSTSSLSANLNDFFGAMNKVANDPSSIAARQTALSNADNVVQTYNSLNSKFKDLNSELSKEMIGAADQINNYATSIADLNTKISKFKTGQDGSQQPNDLLDQRDLLINKLSTLVNVNVVPQGNGMQSVYIGKGQPLVLDGNSNKLLVTTQVSNSQKLDISLQTPTTTQVISGEIVGGSLSGTIRFRDELLEPAQQSLKNIAETMTASVNQVHSTGYDLDGGTGTDFFTFNTTTGELTNKLSDPRKLAAASSATTLPGDNRNALALANLQNSQIPILQNGIPTSTTTTLQDAYGQVVSKVGSLANAAKMSAAAQESLLNNAKTANESLSGVNLDEEAANLIKYQQSYQAAAQLISVTKGIFDSLLSAFR